MSNLQTLFFICDNKSSLVTFQKPKNNGLAFRYYCFCSYFMERLRAFLRLILRLVFISANVNLSKAKDGVDLLPLPLWVLRVR